MGYMIQQFIGECQTLGVNFRRHEDLFVAKAQGIRSTSIFNRRSKKTNR